MNQTILSIQSFVSYGHVGNSSITFPLQRLGVQVIPIHTVLFSNHTGYGSWRGTFIEIDVVREIFKGIYERDVLPACDALLSGYMGSHSLGHAVIEILSEMRQLKPDLIYCCDPVMGDVGRGFFVKEKIPEFFRDEMIRHATLTTPNHFELEYLSGGAFNTIEGAVRAARSVMKQGPSVVVVTSLRLSEDQEEQIHALVVGKRDVYLVSTPHLPIVLNGTGDLTAALFTHFYISSKGQISVALEKTISRVFSIINETLRRSSRELVLIQAQQELVSPQFQFSAKKVE